MGPTLGESFQKLQEQLEKVEEVGTKKSTAGDVSTDALLKRVEVIKRGREPKQPLTEEEILKELTKKVEKSVKEEVTLAEKLLLRPLARLKEGLRLEKDEEKQKLFSQKIEAYQTLVDLIQDTDFPEEVRALESRGEKITWDEFIQNWLVKNTLLPKGEKERQEEMGEVKEGKAFEAPVAFQYFNQEDLEALDLERNLLKLQVGLAAISAQKTYQESQEAEKHRQEQEEYLRQQEQEAKARAEQVKRQQELERKKIERIIEAASQVRSFEKPPRDSEGRTTYIGVLRSARDNGFLVEVKTEPSPDEFQKGVGWKYFRFDNKTYTYPDREIWDKKERAKRRVWANDRVEKIWKTLQKMHSRCVETRKIMEKFQKEGEGRVILKTPDGFLFLERARSRSGREGYRPVRSENFPSELLHPVYDRPELPFYPEGQLPKGQEWGSRPEKTTINPAMQQALQEAGLVK